MLQFNHFNFNVLDLERSLAFYRQALELEVAEEAASAVLFYVAAQCNSMEYDQRFFQSFYAQYQGKMANLAAEQQGPVAVVEVSGDGRL